MSELIDIAGFSFSKDEVIEYGYDEKRHILRIVFEKQPGRRQRPPLEIVGPRVLMTELDAVFDPKVAAQLEKQQIGKSISQKEKYRPGSSRRWTLPLKIKKAQERFKKRLEKGKPIKLPKRGEGE